MSRVTSGEGKENSGASTSSLHVADQASIAWKYLHPDQRFGNTYHTSTPSQWALQSLSLNISLALANSLTTALAYHSAPTASSPLRHTHSSFRGHLPVAFAARPSPVRNAASPPEPHTLETTLTWNSL